MTPLKTLWLACAGLCLLSNAEAALDTQGQQEIAGLLRFVESSGCNFIRNGSEHSPKDARAHLQKKLDYLNDKGLVDSAEDFIARAATESSFSGTPYQVSCSGQKQDSANWLKTELQRLRQNQR